MRSVNPLRREVLSYQRVRALDDIGSELKELFHSRREADLLSLLASHGISSKCGTTAAER